MSIRFMACMAIALACAGAAEASTTVQSIDRARGALTSADSRASFDRETSGVQTDGFGTHLPDGFTKDMLVRALAPGRDPATLVIAGAKAWPQRAQSFVAMVCLAGSAEAAKRMLRDEQTSCDLRDNYGGDSGGIWFGVFDKDANGAPHLLARTEEAVDVPTDWSSTDIDVPQAIDPMDGSKPALAASPEQWLRFDLAPYKLRADETAFGVRAGWSEGYAGGGANFEALYLFLMQGHALRVVFAEPMMFNKMIAGEWHKDGTRSHDMSDASNALNVLATQTDGFHDIELRERGGKWRKTFRWSAEAGRYIARKR